MYYPAYISVIISLSVVKILIKSVDQIKREPKSILLNFTEYLFLCFYFRLFLVKWNSFIVNDTSDDHNRTATDVKNE